ncbi:lytic transglycosylase domain-containing protein [Variovorax boronicumulans]
MSVFKRSLWLALLLCMQQGLAHAADIYGYIDSNGVAHFAAEKVDERYKIFFQGGQSFDTAKGISPLGRGGGTNRRLDGKVSSASQNLLAMFEASPGYKTAKSALRDASSKHAIDYELLQALVATESGFDARAVSPKGAMGLMQLMPATAQRYGVATDKRGTIEKKLFDPHINIAAGSRYLRDLIAMFPGQIELALAAYNAGEGAVQRAGNKIPNYKETQNYVQTVLQLYAYLKPSAVTVGGNLRSGTGSSGGGKTPGRIRMEMSVPKGGAIGRGNMPSESPRNVPTMPEVPELSDVPTGAVEPGDASPPSPLS